MKNSATLTILTTFMVFDVKIQTYITVLDVLATLNMRDQGGFLFIIPIIFSQWLYNSKFCPDNRYTKNIKK